MIRRLSNRTLLFALVLCAVGTNCLAVDAEAAASWRAETDTEFRRELRRIAAICERLKLAEQARITREWFIERDPRREYLFLPPARDPVRVPASAISNLRNWHKSFTKARKEQAARLFTLARVRLDAGHPAQAYRLLHEVLREDPDHEDARRITGYRQDVKQGWRRVGDATRATTTKSPLPRLGWKPGNRWRIKSEHFQINTRHSSQAGLQVAEELERLHAVWRQVFFDYWSSAAELKRLFSSGAPATPRKKHDVVLFRDRETYLTYLTPKNRRVGLSQGIYFDTDKTTYLYVGDAPTTATWYHEAAHQLFSESGRTIAGIGEQQNFWIIEGIALYMESLAIHDGYCTIGGADADRLQFARFRYRNDEFYRPLDKLVRLTRQTMQADAEVRMLYSQAAGLAHMMMDHQGGQHRAGLMRYLRLVYQKRDKLDTLAAVTGMELAQLDALYRDSLAIDDADLAHLNPPAYVRNLSLGSSKISDQGLAHLSDCSELTWLDLSYTRTTNDGLAHLAGLTKLEEIFLTGTKIDDAGLKHLYQMKQLKTLDLQQTQVTAAGVRQLKSALPNLKEVNH